MSVAREWNGLLGRRDVLIVDTETTGTGVEAEIVDIAIVDTTGKVVYAALVLPEGCIPSAASAVHGLTRSRLVAMGARPWVEHHAWVEWAMRDASVLLAYNLAFDVRMLKQIAKRHGMAPHLPAERRCLMLDYAEHRGISHKWREGGYRWHKLDAAAAHEGVQGVQSHRALGDAQRALALMRAVAAQGGIGRIRRR